MGASGKTHREHTLAFLPSRSPDLNTFPQSKGIGCASASRIRKSPPSQPS